MKNFLASLSLLLVTTLHGGPRTSVIYSIPSEGIDGGGSLTSSALYSGEGSVGSLAAVASSMSYGISAGFPAQAPPSVAPAVVTTLPTLDTSTTATLNGTVNANGSSTVASFDVSPDGINYSNVPATPSPVTGTVVIAVTANLTGLTPGTLYHVRARGQNDTATVTGDDLTFTTLPLALAGGDAFANRTSLGNAPNVDVAANNNGATMEVGESTFGGLGGASVWYQWTAPTTGWVTVHTAGSELDTVLGVFTGSTLAGLAELGHNDVSFRQSDFFSGSNDPSRLVFYAQAGTSYQIAVQGYVDASNNLPAQTGDFELHISPEPALAFRITALSLSPSSVDVTDDWQEVVVTLSVDSNAPLLTGDLFSVQIVRPDSRYNGVYLNFTDADRISGTATSGTYSVTASLPQYALPGLWSLRVEDYGDEFPWTSPGADLIDDNYILPPAAGGRLSVVNTGTVDSTPPAVISVSGVPASVNVSAGDVTFNVVVSISDALAGFGFGNIDARSASTGQTFDGLAFFNDTQRTSGDEHSGTYTVPVTIPQGSANGTYYLALDLSDSDFNQGLYSDDPSYPGTGLIPPNGTALTFQITGGTDVPGIAIEQPVGTPLSSTAGTVSFGDVLMGQSASRVFTIRNSGTATLTDLVVEAYPVGNAADFALGSLGATSLAPGATTTFSVTFTPGALGNRFVGISVSSNVSMEAERNPFNVVLTGTGLTFTENWRQQYFGTTSNSGDAADNADPFHTGIPNLAVLAYLGPNKNPSQARPNELPQAEMVGSNLVTTFTEPAGVTGIIYGAEWSASLQSNDWHPISDTGTGSQHIFSVPVGSNSKLFMRLKATNP